jgi:hypothetical protein
MTPNQPGGGDGEKRACFRIEIWFVNYRGPHLTRKRYAAQAGAPEVHETHAHHRHSLRRARCTSGG